MRTLSDVYFGLKGTPIKKSFQVRTFTKKNYFQKAHGYHLNNTKSMAISCSLSMAFLFTRSSIMVS